MANMRPNVRMIHRLCRHLLSMILVIAASFTAGAALSEKVERATELDAGLWRSEFAPQNHVSAVDQSPKTVAGDQTNRRRHTEPTADDSQHQADVIPVSVNALTDSRANPGEEQRADAAADQLVSDWDQSAVHATGASELLLADGPSLTTYIVGCVAMIVVIGAIMSPR